MARLEVRKGVSKLLDEKSQLSIGDFVLYVAEHQKVDFRISL